MTKGEFDDLEMEEREEEFRSKYDMMSDEELRNEYDRFDVEDYDSLSAESKEEFNYIKEIIESIKQVDRKTSFTTGKKQNFTISSDFNGTLGLKDLFGGDIFDLTDFINFTPVETDGPNSKELLSRT